MSCILRSHATYYFIAAGCHVSVKNYTEAQKLLDMIPDLLEKKKIGGKDLPTEVFIKKKRRCSRVVPGFVIDAPPVTVTFYRTKQERRTGSDKDFAQCIRISPAEGPLEAYYNDFFRI